MLNFMLIIIGKLIAKTSRLLNLGSGSTWPGHIALSVNKNFIKDILKNSQCKVILIAGTNGKTTTGKLIQTILENAGKRVFQNEAGANLLNGIASSIVLHSSMLCALKYDFAIFEIDENTLPLILKEITPDYLILLNLFRDQLDRYGEVNAIASKWSKAIEQLSNSPRGEAGETIIILNADDPQIASLRLEQINHIGKAIPIPDRKHSYDQVFYFGLEDRSLHQTSHQHAVDSTYCPKCRSKLTYSIVYYSHLGVWKCDKCGNARPKLDIKESPIYPLPGVYNKYNTIAAVLFAKLNNISKVTIKQSLLKFKPAFGRQEILNYNGKKVQIFLSKNPTSFNESLRTVASLRAPARIAMQSVAGGKNLLIVLNDRIPDGRDVSWIWDVDFEEFIDSFKNITISGDRCYDMGLRIKYANSSKYKKLNIKYQIEENLEKAVKYATSETSNSETLYILPTYSAMLEIRKILTGKKIF